MNSKTTGSAAAIGPKAPASSRAVPPASSGANRFMAKACEDSHVVDEGVVKTPAAQVLECGQGLGKNAVPGAPPERTSGERHAGRSHELIVQSQGKSRTGVPSRPSGTATAPHAPPGMIKQARVALEPSGDFPEAPSDLPGEGLSLRGAMGSYSGLAVAPAANDKIDVEGRVRWDLEIFRDRGPVSLGPRPVIETLQDGASHRFQASSPPDEPAGLFRSPKHRPD